MRRNWRWRRLVEQQQRRSAAAPAPSPTPASEQLEPSAQQRFEATVVREGRWWIIRVDEIGITQARELAGVELAARELVAVMLDVDLADVNITIVPTRWQAARARRAPYGHGHRAIDDLAIIRAHNGVPYPELDGIGVMDHADLGRILDDELDPEVLKLLRAATGARPIRRRARPAG